MIWERQKVSDARNPQQLYYHCKVNNDRCFEHYRSFIPETNGVHSFLSFFIDFEQVRDTA